MGLRKRQPREMAKKRRRRLKKKWWKLYPATSWHLSYSHVQPCASGSVSIEFKTWNHLLIDGTGSGGEDKKGSPDGSTIACFSVGLILNDYVEHGIKKQLIFDGAIQPAADYLCDWKWSLDSSDSDDFSWVAAHMNVLKCRRTVNGRDL